MIDNKLIPVLTNGQMLRESELLSSPVQLGRLGILILSDVARVEHVNSKSLCRPLTTSIINQNDSLTCELIETVDR